MEQGYRQVLYHPTSEQNKWEHPRIVSLGGDHSIVLPILRSLKQVYGPISVIHLDSHLDTSVQPIPASSTQKAAYWTWETDGILMRVILESLPTNRPSHTEPSFGMLVERVALAKEPVFMEDWERSFLLVFFFNCTLCKLTTLQSLESPGLRNWPECWIHNYRGPRNRWDRHVRNYREGPEHSQRYTHVSFYRYWWWGSSFPILELANLSPSVLDPSIAPATGTPESGGWTTRELKRFIKGLEGIHLVGADVVEVSPPYDSVAETTSVAAADLIVDILASMAKLNEGPKVKTTKDELWKRRNFPALSKR